MMKGRLFASVILAVALIVVGASAPATGQSAPERLFEDHYGFSGYNLGMTFEQFHQKSPRHAGRVPLFVDAYRGRWLYFDEGVYRYDLFFAPESTACYYMKKSFNTFNNASLDRVLQQVRGKYGEPVVCETESGLNTKDTFYFWGDVDFGPDCVNYTCGSNQPLVILRTGKSNVQRSLYYNTEVELIMQDCAVQNTNVTIFDKTAPVELETNIFN
jgi:hypothetical protein